MRSLTKLPMNVAARLRRIPQAKGIAHDAFRSVQPGTAMYGRRANDSTEAQTLHEHAKALDRLVGPAIQQGIERDGRPRGEGSWNSVQYEGG